MKKIGFTLFLLLSTSTFSFFKTEVGTFEAFYIESSSLGWIGIAITAVIIGATIAFSGGLAAAAAPIGTWIGSTFLGLNGAAATSAGLALLGGGSLASGGAGMLGGAIVVTAFTFSTELVIDYSANIAFAKYSHSKFLEDSKKFIQLPLPQNEEGSELYEKIVEDLKENSEGKLLYSDYMQEKLTNHRDNLRDNIKKDDKDDYAKDLTLLSYLCLVIQDFDCASKKSLDAIEVIRSLDRRRTLPAAIHSISEVSKENYDFNDIIENYFNYSILAEPKNTMAPLLFTIFLERISYRLMNDNNFDYKNIYKLESIIAKVEDDETRDGATLALLGRYFILLKDFQQNILVFTEASNSDIINSDDATSIMKNSFLGLEETIERSKRLVSNIENKSKESEAKKREFSQLIFNYQADMPNLKERVVKFEESGKSFNFDIKSIWEKIKSWFS